MGTLTKNYPYTSLLALLGFLIGILFLITLDFSIKYDGSEILKNPSVIAGYIKDSLGILINSIMLGVSAGIILGVVGFFIDFLKRNKSSRGEAMIKSFSNKNN